MLHFYRKFLQSALISRAINSVFRKYFKVSLPSRHKTFTQEGDLVQLVSPTNKVYIIRLISGGSLQTHRGVINFDELIGMPWGSQVSSHIGSAYFLLQPSLGILIQEIKRNTQIMYPKDIGYILVSLGIGPGTTIIEAGTGSGALTTAFAWAVGTQGRVYSYEVRQEIMNLAKKNLERLDLLQQVDLKLKDVNDGFDEESVDVVFLDLPNPYDFLPQVKEALIPGGFFGSLVPTVNQVERLLQALHEHQFAFVDVCEILLRFYKPNPVRLRPTDRMVAHTGYLIFARNIQKSIRLETETGFDSPENARE
ncbi:MAG: tRNA (adenine-N1)-methyltransferase [Anaerolineales bacterium]|nr:MAG: tRNA (adenine-N1)-methyltransferase [Anaerolineales bacterium]